MNLVQMLARARAGSLRATAAARAVYLGAWRQAIEVAGVATIAAGVWSWTGDAAWPLILVGAYLVSLANVARRP